MHDSMQAQVKLVSPQPGGLGFRARSVGDRQALKRLIDDLKQCSKARDLERGKNLHRDAAAAGFQSDRYVASALITMYSRCRSMASARQVFEVTMHRDAVMWNALIMGYVENGESSLAMDFFNKMDCTASPVTYLAALKACGSLASSEKQQERQVWLERGISIHKQIEARGLLSHKFVGNTLLDMYGKCGRMDRAREVFDRMSRKDVVAWSSLMLGYAQNGDNVVALDLFAAMDCEANAVSYVAALKACAGLASEKTDECHKQLCVEKGIAIHEQIKNRRLDGDIAVATTLIDMYSKCGSMDRAREIFDRMTFKDTIAWTSLIVGYVENGESSQALEAFTCMDSKPDCVTYVAALKACANLASSSEKDSEKQFCLEKGAGIHEEAKRRGFESDLTLCNSLVDMYCKCNSTDQAREVFDRMIRKDVVSWNSILMGYVQNEESYAALNLFSAMDCEADHLTYVAALKACSSLCALPTGHQIHAAVCRLGLEQIAIVANALMDFYGKCGSPSKAEEVFNNIQSPSLICWNALITGYSSAGDPSRVFSLAKMLQEAGLQMDRVTFTCVLAACSHVGLVDEAKACFQCMLACGIKLNVDQYNCMVDVLGRANRLEEALDLARGMPIEADQVTWITLLAACRKWNNMEVGKIAFDALGKINSLANGSAPYVLMSDIYKRHLRDNPEEKDAERENLMVAAADPGGRTDWSEFGSSIAEVAKGS